MSSQVPTKYRVGDELRRLLDERFLTQRELAVALGTSERQVGRWVTNETGPTKTNVRVLAEFFGVAPASLLGVDASDSAPAERAA